MKSPVYCRFRPPNDGTRAIVWEITNLCNMKCRHCCTMAGETGMPKDTPLETVCKVMRELNTNSVSMLYFSGGEPFARPDFAHVLTAASALPSIEIYVATNGTLLTPAFVKHLVECRIKQITVSLDGATADSYAALRIDPKMFAKAIAGIEMCLAVRLPVRLSVTVNPHNVDEIPAIIEMAAAWRANIVLSTILMAGRATGLQTLVLTPKAMKQVEMQILAAKRQLRDKIDVDYNFEMQSALELKECPAGLGVLHISADGNVSPCSWLLKREKDRYALGNINHTSLTQCLRSVPNKILDRSCCLIK